MNQIGLHVAPPLTDAVRPPSSARILLVDDDERNLLALGHVLKDVAEVVTASSGREALRHLLHDDFAVILLDVFMPEMDGYEVADLIRQRKQTARIPIIFLSAVNKETEHMLRGYSMGAVDYVFKPVDPVILKSKVGVFVDLFDMRMRVEANGRAEQELREAGFRAQLDRLRIESELNAARARQATMLEALPLALFEAVTDASGLFVREFVAGDLAKLAGPDGPALESGELCWEDRIHPDDRIGLGLTDTHQTVFSAEYRWCCGDKSHRYFIERAVAMSCGEDGSTRWVGTLFDVTDRKQLEAQLVQAGKLDALGQLTGGVAHDFNNVLAAVLGGVRLLERKVPLDEAGRKLVEQMRLAAERGAELVRRMMAFARQQELTPIFVPPGEICEAVSGLVEQTLGGTVSLAWQCHDTDLLFFADRSQLELAIVNLIINARDAMPGGGAIGVSITPEPDRIGNEKHWLCIEVRDEGTGIPRDVLQRITEPFFTTKEIGRGTGLGLSMVAGFVQQSGGRLEIESEEGVGTVVRIHMPARQGAGNVAEPVRPSSPSALPVACAVVLVDDDPMVRTVVAEQLRDLGATVTEIGNGTDAVRIIAETDAPIDLLLTDFAMPGLNGLQTIEHVRTKRPGLRCALMTGYADGKLELILPGNTILLRKPIPQQELEAVLQGAQRVG